MSPTNPREELLLHRLSELAANSTGFSLEAISREALGRTVREQLRRGKTLDDLLRESERPTGALMELLRQVVLVGETFFFRHPEHFRLLVSDILPYLRNANPHALRCWSAGCSSGEEAYSIAACLLATLRPESKRSIEVLGTDISEQRLAIARKGTYRPWSQRQSGPLLHPIFKQLDDGRTQVLEEVRSVTTFMVHNLLDAADRLGQFDIIFCRNVLVYFTRPAADLVRRHLSNALLPGGFLIFGTMDVHRSPPSLVSAGPQGMQVFTKPDPRRPLPPGASPVVAAPQASAPAVPRPAPPKPAAPPPPPPPAPVVVAPPPTPSLTKVEECIAMHLNALALIERGQDRDAAKALVELTRRAPDYLPGILELALLHDRTGQPSHAQTLMREVLRRADALDPEQVLPGPEPLPVIFYGTSARAFFERHGGRA